MIDGSRFYESQSPGLGEYFLDSLFAGSNRFGSRAVLDCRRDPERISERLRES